MEKGPVAKISNCGSLYQASKFWWLAFSHAMWEIVKQIQGVKNSPQPCLLRGDDWIKENRSDMPQDNQCSLLWESSRVQCRIDTARGQKHQMCQHVSWMSTNVVHFWVMPAWRGYSGLLIHLLYQESSIYIHKVSKVQLATTSLARPVNVWFQVIKPSPCSRLKGVPSPRHCC